MPDQPTVGDLCAGGIVADADLDKAVQAYLDDVGVKHANLGGGYVLDVARAVAASEHASGLVGRTDVSPASLREAVRAAVLRAVPDGPAGG